MRVIEQRLCDAVRAGRPFRSGNTVARVMVTGGFRVELHGNAIAWAAGRKPDGTFHGVTIDHCGWKTATTKSRINALLSGIGINKRVYQRDGAWFISDFGLRGHSDTPFDRYHTL